MDSTALSLCMDNGLPIHVFNMDDERNIDRIVSGERVGTLVDAEQSRMAETDRRAARRTPRERMDKSVEATQHEFAHGAHRAAPARRCSTASSSTTTARRRRSSSSRRSPRPRRACSPSSPTTRPRSRRSRRRSWSPTSASRRTTTATLIRLAIPELTEERRKRARQGRARPRRGGPRRDPQHPPRRRCTTCASCKNEGEAGADDEHRAEVELQKLTDARDRRARRRC